MKITDVPVVLLRVQYRLARLPFEWIDHQLAARLGTDAPPRQLFERSLGTLDVTVGQLLGDSQLKRRGSALVARSDAFGEAARLDTDASRRQQQADAKFASTCHDVVTDIQEARDATEQQAVEARLASNEEKKAARHTAQERAAAAEERVDEAADERVNEIDAAVRAEKTRVRHAEQTAANAASAKMRDSQAKRRQAAEIRAQADRIEDAAAAEKQNRP